MLSKNNKYDVIIIGGGCSGSFVAYELIKLNSNKKALVIEKGNPISKRICPKRKTGKCVNCKPCHIVCGSMGAGVYSDFKLTLNYKDDIGGELSKYIEADELKDLVDYIDNIYLEYGADPKVFGVDDNAVVKDIRRKAINNNIKFIQSKVRHVGTEIGFEIFSKMEKYLIDNGVDFLFKTNVEDLIVENNKISGVLLNNNEKIYADNVVLAIGRYGAGSGWLDTICNKHSIESQSSTLDIGVRIEVRNEVMKEVNENLYEGKFYYRTPTFDDQVRTFCQCYGGAVAMENYDGIKTVNGHSYKNEKTENTNLALLVSKSFTQPFTQSIEFGKAICSLANMLAGGNGVIVQRYGDFKKGRRTTQDKLKRGNIIPTLKDAVAGDLSLVFPFRILKDIEETIEALNGICEGFSSEETLLYGVECKFISNKLKLDNKFQTNIKGLFAIGDGSGVTRGVSQSNCMGIKLARILENNSDNFESRNLNDEEKIAYNKLLQNNSKNTGVKVDFQNSEINNNINIDEVIDDITQTHFDTLKKLSE